MIQDHDLKQGGKPSVPDFSVLLSFFLFSFSPLAPFLLGLATRVYERYSAHRSTSPSSTVSRTAIRLSATGPRSCSRRTPSLRPACRRFKRRTWAPSIHRALPTRPCRGRRSAVSRTSMLGSGTRRRKAKNRALRPGLQMLRRCLTSCLCKWFFPTIYCFSGFCSVASLYREAARVRHCIGAQAWAEVLGHPHSIRNDA